MVFEKGEITLYLNHHVRTSGLDVFFKYSTFLGDGLLILLFFVVSLFVKFRYALMVGLSGLFQLVLVHLNKKILFPGIVRPKLYLKDEVLYFAEGVTVHGYNTFPSGHTTTAFALFFLLSLIVGRPKYLQVFFFITALVVGISRVYLLQHFVIDVYFGAAFGVASSWAAFLIATKAFKQSFWENKITLISRQ